MHKDIKKLNKEDPPPTGYRHPAYEVYGSGGHWRLGYLKDGMWIEPVRVFPNEAAAYRYLLNLLYYGEE